MVLLQGYVQVYFSPFMNVPMGLPLQFLITSLIPT